MIKFYERVFDIIGENYDFDKNGDIVIKPGISHTLLRYVNELSEYDEPGLFNLLEGNDNKEFVLSLTDDLDVDIELEDEEEFIEQLNKIDEETVQEMHESLESLMTEEDYKEFESLVRTLKHVYAQRGTHNAS